MGQIGRKEQLESPLFILFYKKVYEYEWNRSTDNRDMLKDDVEILLPRLFCVMYENFLVRLTIARSRNKNNFSFRKSPSGNRSISQSIKLLAKKYGALWILLAGVHRIETQFSTLDPMISSVGAKGHMQFLPCTSTTTVKHISPKP